MCNRRGVGTSAHALTMRCAYESYSTAGPLGMRSFMQMSEPYFYRDERSALF
jgi:hypothetical protein